MSTTHPSLPTSLLAALAEFDMTIPEWEALSRTERNELGLSIGEHRDAFAGLTEEEVARAMASVHRPVMAGAR